MTKNWIHFWTLQEVGDEFALCSRRSVVKVQNNQRGWRYFDVQPVGSGWTSAIISQSWDGRCLSSGLLHAATVPLLGLQVRQWAHCTLVPSRFRCFTRPRSVWVLLFTPSFPFSWRLCVHNNTLFAGSEVETSFAASGKRSKRGWSLELRLMHSGDWTAHLVDDNLTY